MRLPIDRNLSSRDSESGAIYRGFVATTPVSGLLAVA